MGGALSPRWKRGRIGTIACRKYVIDFSRGIRVDREEKKKKKKKKKRKKKKNVEKIGGEAIDARFERVVPSSRM